MNVKVVIVHESDLRDASRILGKTLTQVSAALVVAGSGGALSLANPADVGVREDERNVVEKIVLLLKGAEARLVGLRPQDQATTTSVLSLSLVEVLPGGVKANSYALTTWLTTPPPPPPAAPVAREARREENYRQIAIEATTAKSGIIVATDAFKRANKLAQAHGGGEGFADFIESGCTALVALAAGSAEGRGVDAALKEVLHVEFAPSGPEAFSFTHPHTGEVHSSRFHLKPHRELGGFRSPTQKPRLYFHVLQESDGLYVVILYLGPHPTGTKNDCVVAEWK